MGTERFFIKVTSLAFHFIKPGNEFLDMTFVKRKTFEINISFLSVPLRRLLEK